MKRRWLIAMIPLLAASLRSQTPASVASPPSSAESAEQLFGAICARCHGLDGRGAEHGPNIATNPEVRQRSDADLFRVVHDGMPAAGMPGFGAAFNARRISAIVTWMRVLQ